MILCTAYNINIHKKLAVVIINTSLIQLSLGNTLGYNQDNLGGI